MSKTKIFSRFDVPTSSGLDCSDSPSLTQQHFKDECDINYLLRHYNDIPKPPPVYGDCTQYSDLQSAINLFDAAAADFQAIPSDIRAKFGNNPVTFFNFCNNPANKDELINLGLAKVGPVSLDVTGPTDSKSISVSSSPSASTEVNQEGSVK